MSLQDIQSQVNELWQQAYKSKVENQWKHAIDCYSRIINLAPRFAPAYVERGMLVQELVNPDKALVDYETALQIDPQYGLAYYGRAWVKVNKGDYEGALLDAKKGLLLDRENAGMYYRRIGAAYSGLRRYNEAIDTYNEAIKLNSDKDEGTIYNRGLCYTEMGQYQLALADFNRCLELDPDWAWAFSARGKVYFKLKEYNKAIADCTEAIKYQPNYILSYIVRGDSLIEIKEDKKAKADLEVALKLTKSPKLKQSIEQRLKSLKKSWW